MDARERQPLAVFSFLRGAVPEEAVASLIYPSTSTQRSSTWQQRREKPKRPLKRKQLRKRNNATRGLTADTTAETYPVASVIAVLGKEVRLEDCRNPHRTQQAGNTRHVSTAALCYRFFLWCKHDNLLN
jgi:hypothetical protein